MVDIIGWISGNIFWLAIALIVIFLIARFILFPYAKKQNWVNEEDLDNLFGERVTVDKVIEGKENEDKQGAV